MRNFSLAIAAISLAALVGFASDPISATRAMSVTPIPEATPEKQLDAEAVAALLDELKSDLPNFIDDEDTVTAIIEKWDTRKKLAGLYKIQILKILIDDVRTFVEDKEIRNDIAESWGVEDRVETTTAVKAPKPVPPTPVPPVSAPPKPVVQSSCRAAGSLIRTNRTVQIAFVNASYSPFFATGTVRCFDEEKGFGFITPDDGGADIFVHHTAINMDGFRTLKEGQKVQYELLIGPKGQRSAVNVQAA